MRHGRVTMAMAVFAFAFLLSPAFAQSQGQQSLLGRSRTALQRNSRQVPVAQTSAAQAGSAASAAAADANADPSLNWDAAPVDIVLQAYGDRVKKTILKDPACPSATITLKSRPGQKLTEEEYIEAIETILEMNGVHLEPYGESFVRALPRKDVRKEGIPLIMNSETRLGETSRTVSMMINFKNISTEEAQKMLEGLKSNNGILLVFERTNSILVTDTEQNINRMLEIAKMVDVATPVTENVFVRQIRHASAQDIQEAIQKIVEESQKEQEKNGKQPQNQAQQQNRPPFSVGGGLLRNRPGQQQQQQPAPANNESLVMSVSDADRGMIRGKVVIVPDERSNKLIFVTSKSNMDFFDKVIEQLDVETTPDTVVKVYRLKYAEAEDVSDMINDLIGNAPSSKDSGKGNQNQNAKQGTSVNATTGKTTASKKPANQRTGEAKAGELNKENTTVLADKRINGLVVMTQKELVSTVEQIIESMDVKMSQVLIETVILEVLLTDGLETGIDWVHGMQQKGSQYRQAIGGGGGSAKPVSGGASGSTLIDGATTTLPSIFAPGSAGLSYALFSEKLDLAAVISASKNDSHSKYIASPIVMTVDNKEATIDATENRQFLTGWTAQSSGYSGGGQPTPNYSAKDIGLKLKLTPKINPNGTVMLTVEEEYSQFMEKAQSMLVPKVDSNKITYDLEKVDLAIERKMSADILLEDMQTVVLGGLTETKVEESDSGIPILKDIPWVGRWLFGKTAQSETRKELLVFLTPYVLDDAQAAQAEAIRRKNTMSVARPWDDHGWSASKAADSVPQKEQLRRLKDEWAKQDDDRRTKIAIEQEKIERVKKLEAMSNEERELWLKMHENDLHADMPDSEIQDELKKFAANLREKKLQEADQADAEKPNAEKKDGE